MLEKDAPSLFYKTDFEVRRYRVKTMFWVLNVAFQMFKSNNKLKLNAKIMMMVYGIVLHNGDLSSVLNYWWV